MPLLEYVLVGCLSNSVQHFSCEKEIIVRYETEAECYKAKKDLVREFGLYFNFILCRPERKIVQ